MRVGCGWISLLPRCRLVATLLGLTILVGFLPAPAAQASDYSPGPVANVQVAAGNGTLRVSWSPPEYAGESYSGPYSMKEYWVSADPDYSGSTWGWYGSCRTGDTSCTITGLTNGANYTLEITAYNSGYFSSKVAFGPVTPCCAIPSPPATVVVAAGDGWVEASWDPGTGQGIGPNITYTATTSPPGGSCTTTSRTCRFTGLTNGQAYSVSVTAANGGGTSSPRSSTSVIPKGPPGPPSAVTALLAKGQAQVSWVGPVSTGGAPVTSYLAVASPGGETCQSDGALECTIDGLAPGETYTFTVTAFNEVGAGPASQVSAPAQVLTGPGAPPKVTVKVVRGAAVVTWSAPTVTGGSRIEKYLVQASPGGRTCTTTSLTCTIGGLAPGTTYRFTVRGVNATGPGMARTSSGVRTPQKPTQSLS